MVELNSVVEIIRGLDVVPDMSRFDPAKTFKENGIDSLDVMSVFLAVEEQLGFKLSEEEAAAINTPAQLVAVLSARKDA